MSKWQEGYVPPDSNRYEDYLNDYFSDLRWEQVEQHLGYLTAPGREGRATWGDIAKSYTTHTLGCLLKKHDSVGFHAGVGEWAAENPFT